jgi:hypothetical protein
MRRAADAYGRALLVSQGSCLYQVWPPDGVTASALLLLRVLLLLLPLLLH